MSREEVGSTACPLEYPCDKKEGGRVEAEENVLSRKGLGDRRDWRDLRSIGRNQLRERLKGKMEGLSDLEPFMESDRVRCGGVHSLPREEGGEAVS